jgi:hypothetical protein
MKAANLVVALLLITSTLYGQQNPGNSSLAKNPKPKPFDRPETRYSVVQRDANSRVWQRTTYERDSNGELIPHLHSYIEIATGMHYQKDGRWVESKEEIDIVPTGGAAAVQGQHQIYFPYDIYNGVIEIVTADGERLKARPLAISYFDGVNNVMIAQLTNSAGLLVSSNQVIYTNAFTDIDADLLCTYRRSGFECDLVFRSQPPTPEAYGLNSSNTRLELLTEFFDTPEPQQIAPQTPEIPFQSATAVNAPVAQPSEPILEMADTTLQFGSMTMIRGKVFTLNEPNGSTSSVSSPASPATGTPSSGVSASDTPVSKTWAKIEGRTFLIEEAPVATVSVELQSLPTTRSSGNLTLHKPSTSRSLPPSRIAQISTNRLEIVSAAISRPGVVMDYNIVNSQTNLTFRGDMTYYVSDTVNLYGTNVIEGGAVIKYDTNQTCSVNILGAVRCLTGPYHPAVFTSTTDSSVGESVSSSSPPPCTGSIYFQIRNDFTEDLSVNIYDDDYNYMVSGDTVSADSSGFYYIPATLGQHINVDCYDTDNNEYYQDLFATSQFGCMTVSYDGSSSIGQSGDPLCIPLLSATALSLAKGGSLNDLIIRNVGVGIQNSGNCSVTNVQIVNCQYAFDTESASLYAGNILIANCGVAFGGRNYTNVCEQLTYDNGTYVAFRSVPAGSGLTLVNALITRVSSWGTVTVSTNHVVKLSSTNGVYQTVGAGSYYLATNSPGRTNLGTTSIDSSLLASLGLKTTYPPVVYSTLTISTNVEFGPIAPRDTGTPNLGYHYSPLDYCFGGVTVRSNITFDAGTAIGYFEPGYSYGISLSNHSTNTFNGTATQPCVFARYSTVQEGGNGNWNARGTLAGITTVGNNTYVAQINANFTRCYSLVWDPNFFRDYLALLNVRANNCEFFSGSMEGYWMGLSMTNCLFDRVAWLGTSQKSSGVFLRNCTMHGGTLYTAHSAGNFNWPVWIENCVFDSSTNNMDDHASGNSNITYCAYNAFLNGAKKLVVTNIHDQVVSNFTWQTGPLGRWYQAPSSSLINTGSVTADLVGLYHFTTQTNQIKETDSIVDIGYHYVALDYYGIAVDTDGDAIPDYLEDSNGNGQIDSGESSWLLGIVSPPQSQNVVQGQNVTFSVVAAGVIPLSYQWRSNGIDIVGANASSFTKFVVTTVDEANYSVVVTNVTGSVASSIAVLTVNSPLQIATPPFGQTALDGSNVSFTVGISGNYPVYQWYTNGAKVSNGTRTSGATSSTLTISNLAVADGAFYYTVVATNLFNCVTSSPVGLTVIAKPGIISEPTNTTAIQSDDVTLSVLATGANLYYQWWLTNSFGATNLYGANLSNYTKLVVQTNDAGHYSLVITNLAGSTNANADLTVLVPPWIIQQPTSALTNQGSNATFNSSAVGTPTLFYQWYKNGTNAIANATNALFTINNIQTADAAGYSCVVTNTAGTNMSAWAWLSVILPSGGTNYGWGTGGSQPVSTNVVSMISPTNTVATNPAIYLFGPPISIRATATSEYNYITNVTFYTGTNLARCTNWLGSAIPGANSRFACAWTNSLHGTNLLLAVASDNRGLSVTSAVVYVVMDTAPTVFAGSSQTLIWNTNIASTNLTLTGTVSDDGLPYGLTNILWSVLSGNGSVSFLNQHAPTTTATFTNFGVYWLQLQADDGFATNFSSCVINLERPPIIAFVSPSSNNYILMSNSPVVLSAHAYGPSAAILSVTFYDGLASLGSGIPTLGNNYNFPWASSQLGSHQISAVATDYNGLSSTSVVSVIVVPPLAACIVSPTNGQLFVLTPTNIVLTADVTNFVLGAEVTNVSFSNQFVNLGNATNAGGYVWQLSNWSATNGIYTITVVAHDSAGNTGIGSVTITNNSMPLISIVSPTSLQSYVQITNVTITATASDRDGSITNVAFYLAGTNLPFAVTQDHATNYSLTISNLASGFYPVTAIATDDRGARTDSQIVIIDVRRTTNATPSVAITYPTNGESFGEGTQITITASATNSLATVTNVEFFVNRISIGSDTTSPFEMTECCWKRGSYELVAKATDNLGGVTVSTNLVSITIVPESRTLPGFWDPNFGLYQAHPEGYDPLYGTWGFTAIANGVNGELYASGYWSIDIGLVRDTPLSASKSGGLTNWEFLTDTSRDSYSQNGSKSILVDGTNVYATGVFALDTETNGPGSVRRWDGSNWQPVGNSLPDADETTLAKINGDIYVVGDFT